MPWFRAAACGLVAAQVALDGIPAAAARKEALEQAAMKVRRPQPPQPNQGNRRSRWIRRAAPRFAATAAAAGFAALRRVPPFVPFELRVDAQPSPERRSRSAWRG